MKMKVGDFVKGEYHSTTRYGKITSIVPPKPGGISNWSHFKVQWVNDYVYELDMQLKSNLSNGRRGQKKTLYRADELTLLNVTELKDTISKLENI